MKIINEKHPDRALLVKPLLLIVFLACLLMGVFLVISRYYTVIYASISLLVAILVPVFVSIFIIIKRNSLLLKEIKIRENMEEILKKSESRYRTIFENAREGIFQSTAEGCLINVNPALARIMGYESPPSMIDGAPNIYQLYADSDEREELLRIINERGFIDNYPVRLKHRNGHILWTSLNARVVRDERGVILYYEGSLDDITKRKEAEDAIRDSRKLLNDILQAASEFSVIATDPEGIITVFNRGAELMLGYSSEEVVGKHTLLILHDDLEVAARGRELTAKLGYTVEGFRVFTLKPEPEGVEAREWTYKRKDGSSLPVSLVVSAIRSEDNEITGYLGIATDLTKRKKTEVEIRRLASIVRHTKELVALAELDGQMVFINEAGAEMLGIDPDHIEDMNFMQFVPDHLKGLIEEEIIPKFQDRGEWEGDFQCLNLKTGALMDIHSISFTINDPNALYKKYWVTISHDISLQRYAEKMVVEKDAVLSNIAKNLPGVVFQFCARDNGDWNPTYNSERMMEIFGLSLESAAEFNNFLSRVHEEDRERYLASIKNAVEACTPWDFEGRFIKPSGETIWFHGLSTPTRHEDYVMFDGIFLDVTERKRMEESLHKSEELFRAIVDNATDIIYLVTLEGIFTYISPTWEALIGEPAAEAVGKAFSLYIHPDDISMVWKNLEQILDTGKPVRNVEFRGLHKDGRIIWFSTMTTVLRDSNGTITGFMGIARDITEEKRLAQERRRLELQLNQSQKLDAIGKLAGGVAHDFNNILMGIQGNASMLLLDYTPEDPHYNRLRLIEEFVKRGANLTGQLLGFAREGKYDPKTLSVNDLLKKSLQFFIEARKEIEAEFQLQEDLYHVEADAGQLEQVFMNIFINAGHAMPGGGCIHIKTSNITMEDMDARAFEVRPGHYIRISISDTGTGMDQEILKRIFEPFFTTKPKERGTGLGLASAYGIIKNHGGSIEAHSESGKGSTFNIYLPSSEDEAVDEEVPSRDESLFKGSGGILVVDDEPSILEIASEILKVLGYTMYQAENAKDAISIYREKKDIIDLVILDMILKGTSGSQVLGMLTEINPDVKVILSSGYSLQGEVKKVMDMGCVGFLQKPYNFAELSRIVHQALNQ